MRRLQLAMTASLTVMRVAANGHMALRRQRVRFLRCCGSVCAWSWTAAHDPQRTCRAIARANEAYTFFATDTTDSQPSNRREPVGTDAWPTPSNCLWTKPSCRRAMAARAYEVVTDPVEGFSNIGGAYRGCLEEICL